MTTKKTTFALYFGNRGFFPGSLIAEARDQMVGALEGLGHDVLVMDTSTDPIAPWGQLPEKPCMRVPPAESWQVRGVMLSLPPAASSAVAALKDAGVPILVRRLPMNSARWRRERAATHSAASSPSWTCSPVRHRGHAQAARGPPLRWLCRQRGLLRPRLPRGGWPQGYDGPESIAHVRRSEASGSIKRLTQHHGITVGERWIWAGHRACRRPCR